MTMLKNFWYACELSSAVTSAPRLVKVLGQEIALYRTAAGRAVAMSNLCPHRGGGMAGGHVIDDCLRCPYHGWRFEPGGACVDIPANPKGSPIPKRARIDAYPTEERYGFIWVFLGDLPEAERPPIPPFPEFDQPGWRPIYGEFTWKANYRRVVENGIDFAHGPFVHAQSFGNINKPEVAEHEVVTTEYGAESTLALPASQPKGFWKYLRSKDQPDVPVTLSVFMPNVVKIHIRISPKWSNIIFDANIPVDETTTRTIWVSLRNFFTGAWADGNAYKRTIAVFHEDAPIVEAVRPVVLPDDFVAELPAKSDKMPLAFRRMHKRALEKGWGIDIDRPREDSVRQFAVIPSPARRTNPDLAKAWVMPEVPTVAPQEPQASSTGGEA